VLHQYPSDMAQNFWTAIFAWSACFVITILVSMFTAPREDSQLKGLVYSLTERIRESGRWYERPAFLGVIVIALLIILNLIFK
jgi:SSS family solute:Na+ symporter